MRAWLPFLFLSSGCFTPHQVSLQSALPRQAPSFGTAPACTLEVLPVIDERPRFEQRGQRGEFVRLSYLLPFGFVTGWQSAGPRYAPPRQVTRELDRNVSRLLSTTLRKASVCRGDGGPTVRVQPRVHHLYGMSFVRDGGTFIVVPIDENVDFTFWHNGRQDMWPTVQVDLTLDVFVGDEPLGSETIRERYLFDPGDHLELWQQTAGAEPTVTLALDRALTTAVARTMARAPYAVDRLVAERLPRRTGTERFVAVRLTDTYDFVERMVVDTASGQILTNEVQRRALPVMSRPGEWIVAPLGADGRFLDTAGYARLLEALRTHGYDVRWEGNVSAARFHGGGPTAAPAPLAIPAPEAP